MDSRMFSKETCCHKQLLIASKRKCIREYNAVTLTMPFLKALLMACFHKILKLIFHEQNIEEN